MKKILSSILLALALPAFGQSDGYTFLCDSNGVGLPGFYLNWSNLVGNASTAQLPSNVVVTAQLNTASNNILTNLTAQVATVSNSVTSFQTWAKGYGTTYGAPGGNNPATISNTIALGGYNNTIYSAPAGFLISGTSNTLVTASANSGIIGGLLNRLDYGDQGAILGGVGNNNTYGINSVVLGGFYNRITRSYYPNSSNCVVLGGQNNQVSDGWNSVVLGGASNEVGHVFGFNNVYDGPFSSFNSVAAGVAANPIHHNVFIWADGVGGLRRSTTTNQFLIFASNGVGINTNNSGTNALAVRGNADFTSASIGGVNMMTLFSVTGVSNSLSQTWNYNLLSVSNALQVQITANSNSLATASNTLAARIVTTSNALQTAVITVSNQIASVTSMKAFSCYVPATYSSIGIGFNTPLMPDGNYSVSLVPQDQTTAEANAAGLYWWVGAKTGSGFTIYLSYATNAYNLNFDCIVKQNTQ